MIEDYKKKMGPEKWIPLLIDEFDGVYIHFKAHLGLHGESDWEKADHEGKEILKRNVARWFANSSIVNPTIKVRHLKHGMVLEIEYK